MGRLDTGRAILAVLEENFATFIAGSLAYSAFMSLVPLLALVLIVAGALGDQAVLDRALELSEMYLTPRATTLFSEVLQAEDGRLSASALSSLLFVWGSLRVFRGLSTAFEMFYSTEGDFGFLTRIRDGLIVMLSLAVVLVASVAVGTTASLTSFWPLGGRGGIAFLVVPLVVAFLPIYYVFPHADVSVREIVPGVLFAAISWAVLQGLFQVFVLRFSRYEVYGTIGAVFLVLTWLYVASLLLLVGAAVNVVLAGRARSAVAGAPSTGSSSVSD